jgi:hypothetical protein
MRAYYMGGQVGVFMCMCKITIHMDTLGTNI